MAEQNLTENLEKIVAILDVLLIKLQEWEEQYENAEGMDEASKTVIVTVFNSLLDVIRTERENYLKTGLQWKTVRFWKM